MSKNADSLRDEMRLTISGTRGELALRCRSLAASLQRLATVMMDDTRRHEHLGVNLFGEIQSRGSGIDAMCVRLEAESICLDLLGELPDNFDFSGFPVQEKNRAVAKAIGAARREN